MKPVRVPCPLVVNLNQSVFVMLNADGVEIMRREHAEIFSRFGDRYPFKEPSTTEPTEFQLWRLMQTFGPHISMGRRPPFSTDIEIVPFEWKTPRVDAALTMLETLQAIVDESVFNQQRFAEDTDADYFLRCFRAVKERARAAIRKATTPSLDEVGGADAERLMTSENGPSA